MQSFLDHIRLALGTLRANPLRSLLTLLGIVIGVSTVVAMMALIEGLRLKVDHDFAGLGTNVFQVQKFPSGFGRHNWAKYARRRNLALADALALRGLPSVQQVGAEGWEGAQKASARERSTNPNVQVAGGTPEFLEDNALGLAAGRFLTDDDVRADRQVAVIGGDVADALFPGQDPIGREIVLRSAPYRVVGLFKREGSVLGLVSKDNFIAIPLTAFFRHYGAAHSVNITLMAKSAELVRRAQDEAIAVLRRRRQVPPQADNDFEIVTNQQMAQVFNQLSATLEAATFGVCLLALVVGGIGILNIMLVSVSERTREIGIRKALGARRRRILAQFAIEAVVLSLLGGALGVLLGVGLAMGARAIFAIPTSVPIWAVGLGLGVSTAVGLVFGIYPAARASALDPAVAMRGE